MGRLDEMIERGEGKYAPAEPGLSWNGTTTYELGGCTVTVFHLTEATKRALTVPREAAEAFFGRRQRPTSLWKRICNRIGAWRSW